MKSFTAGKAASALIAFGFLLGACGGGGGGSSTSLPAALQARPLGARQFTRPAFTAPGLPPAGSIYIGAFVDPSGHSTPPQLITETAAFESSIGRKLAIHLQYHLWSDPLIGPGERDDAANGRIPLVSWSCSDRTSGVKDADVAAGIYDSAIAKRATAVAAFGHPIFLRYKWEMNLLHNPNCADSAPDIVDFQGKPRYSPPEFIAAWDHIRTIFAANGANNVIWLFSPSGNGIAPAQYYPGDSEVDWIGFDWYDSFNLFFEPTYVQDFNPKTNRPVFTYHYLVQTFPTKPLMIAETGAVQTEQPLYFPGDSTHLSADQALQQDFPNILAYVYWNSKGTRGNYEILGAGLPSYEQFVRGPYESAMGQ